MLRKFNTRALIITASLVAVNIYAWFVIFAQTGLRETHEYFLDVGQGDSELTVFPGNVKIMTDAGPASSAVVRALERALPADDRYIDIAIASHPDLDHVGGYLDILDRYDIGVFVCNGRDGATDAWRQLMEKIKEKNIPVITLGAGDRIRYEKNEINILSPNSLFIQSAETNDTSLVELVQINSGEAGGFRTLLTADAGFNVEENLLTQNAGALRADVLKVAHHGSKYSSGDGFLRAVRPTIAVIGVGTKNVYGHPTKETLGRIASSTHAAVFRTDRDGTVEIFSRGGKLNVTKEKE